MLDMEIRGVLGGELPQPLHSTGDVEWSEQKIENNYIYILCDGLRRNIKLNIIKLSITYHPREQEI